MGGREKDTKIPLALAHFDCLLLPRNVQEIVADPAKASVVSSKMTRGRNRWHGRVGA